MAWFNIGSSSAIKDICIRPNDMMHLILGRQGSGKTLFLVLKAMQGYKKGKTIYSNVALSFPYKQLDYQDIVDCKLRNAIVILDEIHQLLPARKSMSKTNVEICDGFLSMIRKAGLEVYGTTQTLRKVDVRFREEADYMYMCEKSALINKDGKMVWMKITHNQDLSKKTPIRISMDAEETFSGKMIKFHFLGNPLFKLYDTNQIIKITGLEGKKDGKHK